MTNQTSGNKKAWTQMMTQAVFKVGQQTSPAQLKKGARVPQVSIQDDPSTKPAIYQLIGDRYLIGRSSRACDIVIRNEVVSTVHCSLERDNKNPQQFLIKDENSTNGIFIGRKRIKAAYPLKHGDTITLGPPEVKASVTLNYDNPPPAWKKAIIYSFYGVAGILGCFTLWIGIESTKYSVFPLPHIQNEPVVIYAGDGQTPLQAKQTTSHQELPNLSDFSPNVLNALLASEDSRFYWHFGVDPLGVLRATVIDSHSKQIRQGASTLTQQLARSLFPEVGRENTASRKLKEMIVALKIEAYWTKDDILKTYLNRVFLGQSLYGFEDAARFYFDKSAHDLSPEEAATLVAMLPAPNLYNPVQNYNLTLGLRNRILSRMVEQHMLSPEEGDRARRSRIEISPKAKNSISQIIAPYYYSYVFEELRSVLGKDLALEGNFIIETSLNIPMQTKAEESLKSGVIDSSASQGALVTLDSRTGEILAIVGGKDYHESQFNRASQSKRQPGSTFKLFTYLTALSQGISPEKIYSCDALSWDGQKFKPCERISGGSTDMYGAIAQSENPIALRIAQEVGLDKIVAMAQKLGITSPLNPVPGMVLGQSEVSLLDITGSYGAIANRGRWNRPHAIKQILDAGDCKDPKQPSTCRVIYSADDDAASHQTVVSSDVANTMTQLLRGVVDHGTGVAANLGLGEEAGKTGTTNNGVDLLFIGFIPSRNLTTGIWLGNDNNKPTNSSSAEAAGLWRKYMQKIL
jgi:membrane peptidoglycan carboxypeptidase